MGHKGVCVQALTEGLVQGHTSLLDFVVFGPVKFVDWHTQTQCHVL